MQERNYGGIMFILESRNLSSRPSTFRIRTLTIITICAWVQRFGRGWIMKLLMVSSISDQSIGSMLGRINLFSLQTGKPELSGQPMHARKQCFNVYYAYAKTTSYQGRENRAARCLSGDLTHKWFETVYCTSQDVAATMYKTDFSLGQNSILANRIRGSILGIQLIINKSFNSM